MQPPRLAALIGRDHTQLGTYAVADIDSTLAVAISPGATPRDRPRASDPNEDAGAILKGSGASVLVVADGHFGREASERVVDFVLDALGDDPPDANLSEAQLVALFFGAGVAVQRETTRADCTHPDTRTTLALALIAHEAVQWAAIGDSCVVVVGADGGARVDTPRAVYLGDRFTHADIASSLTRGRIAREDVTGVVCATDGLLDGLAQAGVAVEGLVAAEAADARTAADVAEHLVARVLREGVDDAVTVAVGLI